MQGNSLKNYCDYTYVFFFSLNFMARPCNIKHGVNYESVF